MEQSEEPTIWKPNNSLRSFRTPGRRFRSLASILALGLTLLLLPPTRAGADPLSDGAIAKAETQIRGGDYASAIAALSNLGPQPDRESELRRLWALAIAHARANRPRAALPYLERLVSLAPDNPTYRLELATALEKGGQTDRARYHYDLSRGAGLAPDLTQEVGRRIDRIDRAKNWEGSFEFALTPESNAAHRTEAETILVDNLAFQLGPDSRAQPAQGVKLAFGLTALPHLRHDLRGRFGVSTDARLYDSNAPNDIRVLTELGVIHLGDRSRRIGAGLLLERRWIDDTEYSSSKGGYLTWGRAFGADSRTDVSLSLLRDWTDYDGASALDKQRTVLSGKVTHLATAQLQLRFGVQLEDTQSSLASESGTATTVTIAGKYAFRGGLLVDLELSGGQTEKEGPDSLFGITRKDNNRSARLRLTHRNWTVRGFAPVMELAVESQRSNNIIYSYENTSAAIGFTRRF